MVVVSLTNSHSPLIIASSYQLEYAENAELALLDGVTLEDMDHTCSVTIITGARIEIITAASDNAEEILEVWAVYQQFRVLG